MNDTNNNLLTAVTKCWKIKGWWLVPRPHHSTRPMRLGSRGPNESLECIDREGLGGHRTGTRNNWMCSFQWSDPDQRPVSRKSR